MKKAFNILLKCLLVAVAVVCAATYLTLKSDIESTQAQIDSVISGIKEQKLKNQEYKSILSEENEDDFYRNVARDELDYGDYSEKIYINISGE